ncbi:MAG: creatininase family protein [Deltaproteobacteria bacterium]|nr:creatininase family protein [Deltaproteobacteria bacterium]
MKWGEMRWPAMKALERSQSVVLLPTGSMEQHGPHLPLQVDHFIANRLAEDLEKRMPEVLILPPLWAGASAHHMDFPGTITLRPRVFIDLLREICTCMRQHGFRRIVLLNGHGGNRSSLEVLGQELYSDCGFNVNVVVYWDLVPDLVKTLKKSRSKGMGHSGELETSLMLYLAPHLVDLSALPEGFRSDQVQGRGPFLDGSRVKRYGNIKEHSEIGVDGFPAAASKEDGELFYNAVLEELGKVVGQIRDERLA